MSCETRKLSITLKNKKHFGDLLLNDLQEALEKAPEILPKVKRKLPSLHDRFSDREEVNPTAKGNSPEELTEKPGGRRVEIFSRRKDTSVKSSATSKNDKRSSGRDVGTLRKSQSKTCIEDRQSKAKGDLPGHVFPLDSLLPLPANTQEDAPVTQSLKFGTSDKKAGQVDTDIVRGGDTENVGVRPSEPSTLTPPKTKPVRIQLPAMLPTSAVELSPIPSPFLAADDPIQFRKITAKISDPFHAASFLQLPKFTISGTSDQQTDKKWKNDDSQREKKTRPDTVGKFHGRTLLFGAEVPARHIPQEPLYKLRPIKRNGTKEYIPVDPRPLFYAQQKKKRKRQPMENIYEKKFRVNDVSKRDPVVKASERRPLARRVYRSVPDKNMGIDLDDASSDFIDIAKSPKLEVDLRLSLNAKQSSLPGLCNMLTNEDMSIDSDVSEIYSGIGKHAKSSLTKAPHSENTSPTRIQHSGKVTMEGIRAITDGNSSSQLSLKRVTFSPPQHVPSQAPNAEEDNSQNEVWKMLDEIAVQKEHEKAAKLKHDVLLQGDARSSSHSPAYIEDTRTVVLSGSNSPADKGPAHTKPDGEVSNVQDDTTRSPNPAIQANSVHLSNDTFTLLKAAIETVSARMSPGQGCMSPGEAAIEKSLMNVGSKSQQHHMPAAKLSKSPADPCGDEMPLLVNGSEEAMFEFNSIDMPVLEPVASVNTTYEDITSPPTPHAEETDAPDVPEACPLLEKKINDFSDLRNRINLFPTPIKQHDAIPGPKADLSFNFTPTKSLLHDDMAQKISDLLRECKHNSLYAGDENKRIPITSSTTKDDVEAASGKRGNIFEMFANKTDSEAVVSKREVAVVAPTPQKQKCSMDNKSRKSNLSQRSTQSDNRENTRAGPAVERQVLPDKRQEKTKESRSRSAGSSISHTRTSYVPEDSRSQSSVGSESSRTDISELSEASYRRQQKRSRRSRSPSRARNKRSYSVRRSRERSAAPSTKHRSSSRTQSTRYQEDDVYDSHQYDEHSRGSSTSCRSRSPSYERRQTSSRRRSRSPSYERYPRSSNTRSRSPTYEKYPRSYQRSFTNSDDSSNDSFKYPDISGYYIQDRRSKDTSSSSRSSSPRDLSFAGLRDDFQRDHRGSGKEQRFKEWRKVDFSGDRMSNSWRVSRHQSVPPRDNLRHQTVPPRDIDYRRQDVDDRHFRKPYDV